MDDFNMLQFCETCNKWIECEYDSELDSGFIHNQTAHLSAVRTLTCTECGNVLKKQVANHHVDLDWKD